jgi:putative hydrolase of the HAD superfamily
MKYKAVIFDLYGTLVDNFSIRAHEEVLRLMAAVVKIPAEEFIRLWFESYDWWAIGKISSPEDNIRYICNKLGIPADEDKVKEAAKIRYEFTKQNLKPWPDAVEVLSQLKSMGYKIALISDCSAETPAVWASTVISPFIDISLFSCVVGIKKPDPRIYLQAAEQLGVQPGDCLYVGDGSSQELSGAARVGMHPVLIRAMAGTQDAHRIDAEEWSGRQISRLSEVLTIIKESEQQNEGERK